MHRKRYKILKNGRVALTIAVTDCERTMLDLLPFCGLKRDFQSFLPKNACKHIEKDTKWPSFILENCESNNDHRVRVNKKQPLRLFYVLTGAFR